MVRNRSFMKSWLVVVCAAVFVALASSGEIVAQDPPPTQEPPTTQAGRGGRGGAAQTPARPRPYDEVITSEAITDEGIFTVHRVDDRLFFEIPKAELDKDFLWVTQIKRTTTGAGWGGRPQGTA